MDKMPAAGSAAPGAVHVVDDDEAVRCGLALLLRSVGLAVATHESGLAFLDALSVLDAPLGCLLTDVRMPGLDGLTLLRRLHERGFRRPIIVMTAHGDVSTAVRAMKQGAADFIEKPFDDDALLATIRSALAMPDAAGVTPSLAEQPTQGWAADAKERIDTLSTREREVLTLLAAGKPNKIIAHELGLSPRTVEVHRARMLTRLGVRSLAEAVRLTVQAERGGSVALVLAPVKAEG